MDAVVAGGGLAGLVAARRLADAGADVTLYERRDRVGGRVWTREVDGYRLDRGFQVLFTAYPAARRELDLDSLDLRTFTPGATICRPGERSVLADPLGAPKSALESLLNHEVRLADKLRLLGLRRDLRDRNVAEILDAGGESIEAHLAERGFSRAFVDHFAAPFYGGITLDRSLGTDRAVFEYTFKMLAEGETVVPAAGMAAVPRQLADRARRAGATIETGTAVQAVDADGDAATVTVDGETRTVDAAVVATDPPTARELTGVDAVPTGGKACVTQWVSLPARSRPPMGRRIALNAADERPNQIAPISHVAPEYAPEGRELYAATYLGEQAADDAALFETVRETLAAWYPEARVSELELVGTDRIPFAQFAQPPGFRAGLPDPSAPAGPVVLAGDHTRWSSIQGALESGRVAAEELDG